MAFSQKECRENQVFQKAWDAFRAGDKKIADILNTRQIELKNVSDLQALIPESSGFDVVPEKLDQTADKNSAFSKLALGKAINRWHETGKFKEDPGEIIDSVWDAFEDLKTFHEVPDELFARYMQLGDNYFFSVEILKSKEQYDEFFKVGEMTLKQISSLKQKVNFMKNQMLVGCHTMTVDSLESERVALTLLETRFKISQEEIEKRQRAANKTVGQKRRRGELPKNHVVRHFFENAMLGAKTSKRRNCRRLITSILDIIELSLPERKGDNLEKPVPKAVPFVVSD